MNSQYSNCDMEPEKPPQAATKLGVENLLISSHDVIGRSISANLTFSAMASLPNQPAESSLENSVQSSCASSSPSPSTQTRAHHKREVSRSSDNSDVQPLDSDSSSAVTSRKDKEGKGSESGKSDKVEKLGVDRAANKKKSSWYNVLYPTYKTRSEGFKRIFRDLPADERLVVVLTLAIHVLHTFRLFLCSAKGYLGTWSFVRISKLSELLRKYIWVGNFVGDIFFTLQSLSSQELWQWVHACYGDELGLTSDDEDYVSSTGLDDDQNNPILINPSQPLDIPIKVGDLSLLDLQPPTVVPPLSTPEPFEQVDLGLIQGGSAPPTSTPIRPLQPSFTPDPETPEMVPPVTSEAPIPSASTFMTPSSDALQTDCSDTTESDVEKSSNDFYKRKPPACLAVTPTCPGPHEGRQSLDAVYPIPVDQLFALFFTTSTFFVAFYTSRKTYDIQASTWQPNKETGLKVRRVSCTVTLTQAVGPKTSQVSETQTMHACSRPGRIYVIDSEANNSGIPYADSFYIQNHFCLLRVSESQSRLTVYCQVKYRKSVWGLVKGFIEKNTWAGVEDFYANLHQSLIAEAEALLAGEATSTGKRKSRIIRHRRTRAHHLASSNAESGVGLGAGASSGDTSPTTRSPLVSQLVGGFTDRGVMTRNGEPGGIWSWIILFTLLGLLVLNAILYHKLWTLEAWGKDGSFGRIEIPILSKQPPKSHDEWLKLLQQQEFLHRREMENWQHFLEAAISLLRQAEDALDQLQKTITPSLMNIKIGGMWGKDNGYIDPDAANDADSSHKEL
ncbi:hypothetical protein B566_EDAN008655 [Ephemera danica]|nr:hypothetical protein B566_EDAN008655 [Ephemera danica]